MNKQLQFAWTAHVGINTNDIGISTDAGWVDRLEMRLEYPDLTQLRECLPKLFNFVPYKNIGGMEANIPFYKARIEQFFGELRYVSDALHNNQCPNSYPESKFYEYGLLTNESPFKLSEDFVVLLEVTEDGFQTYGFDTSRRFDFDLVVDGQVLPFKKRNIDPQLIEELKATLFEHVPGFMITQWGGLYIDILLTSFLESVDFEDSNGTYPALNFKYGDIPVKLCFTDRFDDEIPASHED